jgi:hypothetical protein
LDLLSRCFCSSFSVGQRNKSKKDFSPFFVFFFFYSSVLFWTSLFSSISSPLALFLLSSGFGGGGGGGRFCPLRFEPSVVFSSLSSTRRLENEYYIYNNNVRNIRVLELRGAENEEGNRGEVTRWFETIGISRVRFRRVCHGR